MGWSEEEEANSNAIRAIIARRPAMVEIDFETNEIIINESQANRLRFPEYFTGATSGQISIDYVTPKEEVEAAYYYLMLWMNSWVYNV